MLLTPFTGATNVLRLRARKRARFRAMPYISVFRQDHVIKYGGNAMTEPALQESFARDVVLLKLVA